MLKEMKWNAVLRSVIYSILGIILILFPDTTARTLCYIGGGAIVVIGVVTLITYLFRDVENRYYRNDFVLGLVEVLLGLFAIYKAELLIALLPFILGIFVVISGFCKLQNGLDVKRMGYDNWYVFVLLAVVNVIFGLVLLWNPFAAATVMFVVIGAGLVFSGVTDLILTVFVSRQVHHYFSGTMKTGSKDKYGDGEKDADDWKEDSDESDIYKDETGL